MWMRPAPDAETHSAIHVPFAMRLALVVGVALVLYLGVFPDAALQFAQSSVSGLTDGSRGLVGVGP